MQISGPQNRIPDIKDAGHVIDELALCNEVIAIILFGSLARGQARMISDIDLCAVTKKNVSESVKMHLLSFGSDKIDVSFFQDLPIAIRFRVIHEGKILFCRDKQTLQDLMADTVREYLDIAPFIRRNCIRILGITGSK